MCELCKVQVYNGSIESVDAVTMLWNFYAHYPEINSSHFHHFI